MASRTRLGLLAALLVLPVASGPAALAQTSRPPASAVSLPGVGTCVVNPVLKPDGSVGYRVSGQGWTKFVRVHLAGTNGGGAASAVADAKGSFSVSPLGKGDWSASQPVIGAQSATCTQTLTDPPSEPPAGTDPRSSEEYQKGFKDGWLDLRDNCKSDNPPPPDASPQYAQGYKSAVETAAKLPCRPGEPRPSAPPPPG
ncbi:hypothetical protein AB0D54_15720 [Streptomyces xanthophaeus]|uniref:hypothetical protein n=1 Tax=Streptomyces xanthophaeus TaxID=67385 RepID=UPI003420F372